jgi:hypothetical protein
MLEPFPAAVAENVVGRVLRAAGRADAGFRSRLALSGNEDDHDTQRHQADEEASAAEYQWDD